MDVTQVYRRGTEEGGSRVMSLAGGALSIPSFTDPSKEWKTHADSGYCSCPRAAYGRKLLGPCKHVVLAKAIKEARSKRSYGSFTGPFIDADLLAMCMRIFAKVLPNESPADSARLFYEVTAHRYSTLEMREAAMSRHNKVQAVAERRAA